MRNIVTVALVLGLAACAVDGTSPIESSASSTSALTGSTVDPEVVPRMPIDRIPRPPIHINYDFPSYLLDITGQPLHVFLNYEDKGASVATDHAIDGTTKSSLYGAAPAIYMMMGTPLPGVGTALDKTPLSTLFDNFWSGSPPPGSNVTLHDQALAQVSAQIASSGGGSIEAISLPMTGSLGAWAGPAAGPGATPNGFLGFNYVLAGGSAKIHGGPLGATWNVAFDINISLTVDYAQYPCSFVVKPLVARLQNVSISPGNAGAQIDKAFGDLLLALQDRPADIFQSAVGAASSASYVISGTPIAQLFSGFSSVCSAEEVGLGFTDFVAFTDATTRSVNFRMTHPVGGAPGVRNASISSVPSLQPSTIAVNQAQIFAGGQLAVSGQHFSPNQTTNLDITWGDPLPEVTQSNIQWGPVSSLSTITVGRNGQNDSANSHAWSNAIPSTTYEFLVQDCDKLTCTPWSAPLYITTNGSSTVSLVLGNGSVSANVGSATLTAGGTISSTITIPSTFAPGVYTLSAQASGQTLASTTVNVVQSYSPTLAYYDPSTGGVDQGGANCSGSPCNVMSWGTSFSIAGQAFFPSNTVTISLNGPTGTVIGTATADANGNFKTTVAANGWGVATEPVVAWQKVFGATIQASVLASFQTPH